MVEQVLKDLGFERTLVPIEESGCDKDFYYYTLEIGDICLISNADEEALEEGWKVSIFDFPSMEISNMNELMTLVSILEDNTKEK
jgi:hypothetical protein